MKYSNAMYLPVLYIKSASGAHFLGSESAFGTQDSGLKLRLDAVFRTPQNSLNTEKRAQYAKRQIEMAEGVCPVRNLGCGSFKTYINCTVSCRQREKRPTSDLHLPFAIGTVQRVHEYLYEKVYTSYVAQKQNHPSFFREGRFKAEAEAQEEDV